MTSEAREKHQHGGATKAHRRHHLSAKKDKVTKLDMTHPVKINKEIKQDSNKIVFPNLDGLED